jgi:hypothetical protein
MENAHMNRRAARAWGRAIVAAIAMLPCAVITPAASATPTCIGSVQAGSTYTCTPTGSGYVQVTVPNRVTSISVVADGGGGGKNESLGNGGSGARVAATIAVTPGAVLKVYVGAGGGAGLGDVGNVGGTGYGAGGNGGAFYGEGFGGGYGGGGGGSSALVVDGAVTVVAGGGGGGGKYYGGSAGAAAGASGGNGGGACAVGGGGGNSASNAGGGGTSSGTGNSWPMATAGYAGKGGSGIYGAGGSSSGGGGGGGGYGGGGGGNWNGPYGCTFAGGGGAGGSYGPADAVFGSASNAGGVATSGAGGDGQVLIVFTAPAATVPGAPTDLVLSEVTTTGMTAYWTPPTDDGGATVTGYDVTVTPGTTTRVTDPTTMLTGLSPATTYTVSVKAVNTVGPSATDVSGSQATSAPGTPTAAATNLVFSGVTSSAITATWTPPSAVSGWPTLGYQVRVDGGTLTWVPVATTSYTAGGLAPGTSHSFSVTVVNGAGSSPALTGNQSTLATVPDAPMNLVLGPATSTTITASWTAPSNTGGAAISKYTVSVDDGTAIDVAVGTTYTATGLAPSAWHTFSVRAVNTIGASAADLAGAFPTSSPPGSPQMAASSVTVGATATITLTGFTAFSTQTVQVTAPDGTMTSFTVTMDASGAGTGSYTAAQAGSYSVVSAPAATSATFTATAPAPVVTTSPSFISLSEPKRVVDTRGGGRFGSTSLSKVSVKRVKVFGALTTDGVASGLPSSGVGAVALNVTAVNGFDAGGYGFVTVYPCDSLSTAVPDASNLNFAGGQTIPNAVIAPVSADGYVCFSVYGNTDLLVDVSGYFS